MLAGDVAGPWMNSSNALDVNNDGEVTAVDALIVVNQLSRDESSASTGSLSDQSSMDGNSTFFRDTNGDGVVTALDALLVINHLAEAELAAAQSPAIDEDGFQWDIKFGPDSPLGTDIHADSSNGSTLLRSVDGQIGFESHIDRAGDVDWFTVEAETNAIHLEVRSADGQIFYQVFDTAGNETMPVASLTGSGVSTASTYLTGGSNRLLVRIDGDVGRYAFEISDTGYYPNSIAGRSTDSGGVVNVDRLEANARMIVANYQASSLDVSPDSNHGDDLHRDSPMAATPWSADANHTRSSFIDVAGDRDMFRVYNMGGVISFSVHSDEISNIELNAFDHEGNSIAAIREQTGDGVYGFDLGSYDFPSYLDSSGRTRNGIFVQVSAGSGQTGQYTIVRNGKGLHGVLVDALPTEEWAEHVKTQTARSLGRNGDIIGFDAHGADIQTATNVELAAPVVSVSSFLDSPTDKDAFRFTAKTDEIVLAVELHGDLARFDEGAVTLFDASGNRLDAFRPGTTATTRHSGLERSGYYRVVPGSEYVAIVSAEGESAFGRYLVSVESVGHVETFLDVDSAIDVTFSRDHLFRGVQISKHVAEVGGFLTNDNPVDLYRFSTDAIDTKITVDGFGPFEMQLYDLTTGDKINQETDFRWIEETLPGANDNLVRDYLLAVWNPGPDAEYLIDIDLISHTIEDIDSVGDTAETATFVDVSEQHVSPHMVSKSASFHLFLGSSQDVDVYRIVANNSVTNVSTIWRDNTWTRSQHLKVELVDSEGTPVSILGDFGPRDERMKNRRLEFATEVGQTYYVRFSILEGGLLSTHVIIR